ncbi:MAG: hypothetical protein HYZ68_06595 [Chloroflexi bacterium]|nr:hypothetical protein [Chloroflexota bacterium]
MNLESILSFANLIVSSVNVILAFSLWAYILTHNWRNPVARAFVALLAFVTVVHASDVVIFNVGEAEEKFRWLRFQWLGLAFIPAAYLHFSDALLRIAHSFSPLRKLMVWVGYGFGTAIFLLSALTDWVVQDGVYLAWATHFKAGPLFWLYTLYFAGATLWGTANLVRARQRTLTPASRRRLTYLTISLAAPVLGAFPYLLLANLPNYLPPTVFLAS